MDGWMAETTPSKLFQHLTPSALHNFRSTEQVAAYPRTPIMSTQLNMASPAAATPVSASTLSSATSPTASSGGHSEFAVQQFRPAQHPSPLGQSAVRFVSDHESVLLDPQRYDPAEQEMDAAAPLGGLSVVDEQPHVVTSLDDHATALPIPIQVPVTNADIVDSTMGTPTAHHLSPSGDHTLLPDHVRHQLHELARKQQKVQLAGPRRKLFFKPEQVTAAMVGRAGVPSVAFDLP